MAFYGGALQDFTMFIPLHSELVLHRCLHTARRWSLALCVSVYGGGESYSVCVCVYKINPTVTVLHSMTKTENRRAAVGDCGSQT